MTKLTAIIQHAIDRLFYGTIIIKFENGKPVFVERIEKIKL